ncbi:N-acetylmuramoyl-L-alanine amidase-like domain-containing protein [Synechococcus sp. A15-60]|uniref:N-acetylmuramoyl-L-alanine amidase-like domain-containing protein n=1 Tax=Synechococcus sp. A15-60 TaxID=1050655 RepID=UPI001648E1FE|nr:N-acetylmuramoyl-L-alanine amidase-like domain-containing protein [Synechococcus sp. A15-60]
MKRSRWPLSALIVAIGIWSSGSVDAAQTRSNAATTSADGIASNTLSLQIGSNIEVIGDTRNRFATRRSLIAGLSVNQAMARLAESFVGSPYLAMSLDVDGAEKLRLDLTQFDCMLFVEQLLALAWSQSFDQFSARTQSLRYRDGDVSYCNRWHYFQDWVDSAVKQGMLEADFALEGEVSRSLSLNFMSSNRALYPKLRSNVLFDCINALENSHRVQQRFIPLSAIESVLPSLQSGDLFAIATRVEGLDVSHTGVLVRSGSRMDAIHAAPGEGVMRSPGVARYLRSVPDAIGVVIVRPAASAIGTQHSDNV